MIRKIELLSHFICSSCKKWWAIGDYDERTTGLYCPHCGKYDAVEDDENSIA